MRSRDGNAYTLAILGVGTALVVVLVGASTIAALGHGVPKELWAIGGALSGALVGILVPAPRDSKEATPSKAAEATQSAAADAATKESARIAGAGASSLAEKQAAKQAQQEVDDVSKSLDGEVANVTHGTPRNGGRAQAAAGAVVQLHRNALQAASTAVTGAPEDKTLAAALSVKQAAHDAAVAAAPLAATVTGVGWFAAVKTITAEARIFVPLLVFTVALALGVLLGLGVIRPAACPLEALEKRHVLAPSCSYYTTVTSKLATALVALAAAAGGALLGVFATAPATGAKAPG